MGIYGNDVYYDPQKFGLTLVGEVDFIECYEYDIVALWRHEDGTHYWGASSGCSCNSPFDEYDSTDKLETGTFFDFERFLNNYFENHSYQSDNPVYHVRVVDLIAKAMTSFKR